MLKTKLKSVKKKSTKKIGFKPKKSQYKSECSKDGERRLRAERKLLKKLKDDRKRNEGFLFSLKKMYPDLENHKITGIKGRFDVVPETFENGDSKLHRYECELKLKLADKIRSKGMGSVVVDSNDNTIYPFRIASEHQYSSSAGGVINAVLDNDPSTCTEYTSLTALFSLVRIVKVHYRVMRAIATAIPTTVSVGAFRPIMLVPLIDNAGAPGSYSAIEDSPNVMVYQYAWDTSQHGVTLRNAFKGDEVPLWADTSAPASATTFVGCPGCLQIYGESIPVSTETLFVLRELYLEFTNRI